MNEIEVVGTVSSFLVEHFLGKALDQALEPLLRSRLERARDILLAELKDGKIDLAGLPKDEIACVMYRFLRAAQEGSAKRNLRLMARVLVNLEPPSPTLYADEFLAWADTIASLRREEIVVVTELFKAEVEAAGIATVDVEITNMAVRNAKSVLERQFTHPEIDQWLTSCGRSGLVVPLSAWGGITFRTTPLMSKLVRLAGLEALEQPASQ